MIVSIFYFCDFSELRYDSLCKQIIKDMNMYGMCVVDDFLGTTNGLSILKEGKDRTPTQIPDFDSDYILYLRLYQCMACMQREFFKMAK